MSILINPNQLDVVLFSLCISLSLSLCTLDVHSNAKTESISSILINLVWKSTTTMSLHSKQQKNDCCCRCCYCCEYCFIVYIYKYVCVCFFASTTRMWANFFFLDNNLIISTNRAEHFSSFHIRFSFWTAWQIKMKNMIIVSNINFLCLLIIIFFLLFLFLFLIHARFVSLECLIRLFSIRLNWKTSSGRQNTYIAEIWNGKYILKGKKKKSNWVWILRNGRENYYYFFFCIFFFPFCLFVKLLLAVPWKERKRERKKQPKRVFLSEIVFVSKCVFAYV